MSQSYLTVHADKEQLTAAKMATLLHEAKSKNAITLRNEVLPLLNQSKIEADRAEGKRIRKPQPREIIAHELTLDAILADLVLASSHAEALGYCYRSSNRQDFSNSGTKATSRVYEWQLAALENLGLIDRRIGLSANDDFDGQRYSAYRRATRIRATPKLIGIAQGHGITPANLYDHYTKNKTTQSAPIVLRMGKAGGQQGRVSMRPETPRVAELRQQVERINAIYARHSFEGMPPPHVRRTFNCVDIEGFDYNKGGRLYADFQDMRRDARRNIKIDGEPVIELDLKSSQLTILYGITDTQMPKGDPYHVDDSPRSVVKAIVTSMIGLGHTNLTRWPSQSRKDLMDELGDGRPMDTKTFGKLYPIRSTTAKVLRRHPVLHHLSPGKLDWADLQFVESEVLISTILQLGEKYDIPALPIHDSIIIPRDAEELGRVYLTDTFSKLVGRTPTVEVK